MATGSGIVSAVPPITAGYAAQLLRDAGRAADGEHVRVVELMNLWSGLGSVYLLDDEVVYKHIRWPEECSLTQQRQVDSYRAEAAFYEHHAAVLSAPPSSLGMPTPLLVRHEPDGRGISICMTRLHGPLADSPLPLPHARCAMCWLARLHAAYWGVRSSDERLRGLQRVGTYWHLAIRSEEHARMPADGWEGRLRLAARALDARLQADDALQTVVHGDSKPANMILRAGGGGEDGADGVRLLDWQYTGRGCAAKDLANLLTYVTGGDGGVEEAALLALYHAELSAALRARRLPPPSRAALQQALELAIADQARWLSGRGWKTGVRAQPTADSYRRRARAVVDALDGGERLPDEAAYEEAVFRAFPL